MTDEKTNPSVPEHAKATGGCPASVGYAFEYHGGMYMRPVDRGAVLIDHPDQAQFDNDVLADGYYHVEIRVSRLTPEESESMANRYLCGHNAAGEPQPRRNEIDAQ